MRKRGQQRQHEVIIPTLEEVERERNKLKHQAEYRQVLRSTIRILIVVAALSVLAAAVFFPMLQVAGESMEPTLEDGQIIILFKTDKLETGDLVGFYYQSKVLLKRVIGHAGDYIDIDEEGNVAVNGEGLEEPYVLEKSLGECDIVLPYQVPDNRVFVMGDHRSTSIDSRSTQVGCVSEEQIIGRVAFRVWPLNKMGFLH